MSEPDESLSKRFKSNDNHQNGQDDLSNDSPTNHENSHIAIDSDDSDDREEEQLIKKIEEQKKSETIPTEQNERSAEDLVAQFQNDVNETTSTTTTTTTEIEAGPSSNNNQQRNATDSNTNSNARQYGRSLRSKFFTTRKYRSRASATATANNITDSDDDSDDNRTNNDNVPSGATSNEPRLISTSPDSSSSSLLIDTDEESLPVAWSDLLGAANDSDSDSHSGQPGTSKDELQEIKKTIFQKEKPKHTWTALRELYYRENGLTGKGRNSINGLSSVHLNNRVCGSLDIVQRLKLTHKLEEHRGCVNCLNFHNSGKLLATGSDDLKIIIWKWAENKIVRQFDSGHNSNVFQAKFVDFIGAGLNIVSSSRDGMIRHHMLDPSGSSKIQSFSITRHATPVHKIALVPNNPYEVLSASEDGIVMRCDLRERNADRVTIVKGKHRRISLYSVSHHPLDPEFCVCGRDSYVRVYDKRNAKNPSKMFCVVNEAKTAPVHITCAVYNYIGTEILASYNDDIVLFDNLSQGCDEYLLANAAGKYLHKYSGHKNTSTIKGVNFYGPQSEYIMSGSDCGNCFFWDKKTEAIVQWLRGDESGSVNCTESHPSFPVIATCGIDYDVKMWSPMKSQEDVPFNETSLDSCVTRNLSHQTVDDMFDSQLLGFYVQQCLRSRVRRDFTTHLFLYSSDDDNSMDANTSGGGGGGGTRSEGSRSSSNRQNSTTTTTTSTATNNDPNNDDDSDSGQPRINALPCSPS